MDDTKSPLEGLVPGSWLTVKGPVTKRELALGIALWVLVMCSFVAGMLVESQPTVKQAPATAEVSYCTGNNAKSAQTLPSSRAPTKLLGNWSMPIVYAYKAPQLGLAATDYFFDWNYDNAAGPFLPQRWSIDDYGSGLSGEVDLIEAEDLANTLQTNTSFSTGVQGSTGACTYTSRGTELSMTHPAFVLSCAISGNALITKCSLILNKTIIYGVQAGSIASGMAGGMKLQTGSADMWPWDLCYLVDSGCATLGATDMSITVTNDECYRIAYGDFRKQSSRSTLSLAVFSKPGNMRGRKVPLPELAGLMLGRGFTFSSISVSDLGWDYQTSVVRRAICEDFKQPYWFAGVCARLNVFPWWNCVSLTDGWPQMTGKLDCGQTEPPEWWDSSVEIELSINADLMTFQPAANVLADMTTKIVKLDPSWKGVCYQVYDQSLLDKLTRSAVWAQTTLAVFTVVFGARFVRGGNDSVQR